MFITLIIISIFIGACVTHQGREFLGYLLTPVIYVAVILVPLALITGGMALIYWLLHYLF